MNMKRLVVAAIVSAGVLGTGSAASADILVTYPPNPFFPSREPLVQRETPAYSSIIFETTPGPPNVTIFEAAPGPAN